MLRRFSITTALNAKSFLNIKNVTACPRCSVSFQMPWKRRKDKEAEELSDLTNQRKRTEMEIESSVSSTLKKLKVKSTALTNRNPYEPPPDVEERVQQMISEAYDTCDDTWQHVHLDNRRVRFKVLTQMMKEFKHDIPCHSLTEIKTAGDALRYFKTPVYVSTPLENMSMEKLPPNVNIQLEAIRFDPKRDDKFGGLSALEEKNVHVKSIKYRRKYKDIKFEERPGYANFYKGF